MSKTINFTISLNVNEETESGYEQTSAMWGKGQSVPVRCYRRGEKDPYLSGQFVITSLDETSPAQDDSTYTIS